MYFRGNATNPVSEQFSHAYHEFTISIEELSKKFGSKKTTMIKSLLDNSCEHRTAFELNQPDYVSRQKFDPYFTIKHDFEKNKFVQRLCLALKQHGLQFHISTEEKHTVGVFDVIITNTPFLVKISDNNGKKIVVEWKSGATFSLSQLERYLWEATTIILVRVQMSQVIRIRRSDIEKYLVKSLITLNDRSTVISSGKSLQKIPGSYCKGCPVTDCEYCIADCNDKKMISLKSDSMQNDILSAFNNLDQCIEQAIDAVMKELIS